MKLYVDAQLPEALAAAFIAWGFDAAHVRDVFRRIALFKERIVALIADLNSGRHLVELR